MMKDGTIVDSGNQDNLIAKHGRKNLEEVFLELVRNKNEFYFSLYRVAKKTYG